MGRESRVKKMRFLKGTNQPISIYGDAPEMQQEAKMRKTIERLGLTHPDQTVETLATLLYPDKFAGR